MTWVIGYHGPGHVAMVSDIQVSWEDPTTGKWHFADVLRKSFVITPSLLIGFAGSVEFGLQSIELAREISANTSYASNPASFSEKIRAELNLRFDQSVVRASGGLALLIAGVDPNSSLGPDVPIKRAYLATLDSDRAYEIETCPMMQVQSIGSGKELYEQHFDKLNDKQFLHQSGGEDVPMPAMLFAYSTYVTLANQPEDTISRHMHFNFLCWHPDGPEVREYSLDPPLWVKEYPQAIGLIKSEWHTKTRVRFTADKMPKTAESMGELELLLQSYPYTAASRNSLKTDPPLAIFL